MCVAFELIFAVVLAPCLCPLRRRFDIFRFCGPSTPFRIMASYQNHWAHHNWKDSSVGSARRRDLYLNHTQHSQYTIVHAPNGIRTHYHKRRSAADPRLRPRGHWDRFMTCDKDNVVMFILIILEVHVIGTGSYTLIGRVCIRWFGRVYIRRFGPVYILWLALFIYVVWPCLCTLFGRVYILCWPCLYTLIGLFIYFNWPCLCTLFGRVYILWWSLFIYVDWPVYIR